MVNNSNDCSVTKRIDAFFMDNYARGMILFTLETRQYYTLITFCVLLLPPDDNSFIVLGDVTPTYYKKVLKSYH